MGRGRASGSQGCPDLAFPPLEQCSLGDSGFLCFQSECLGLGLWEEQKSGSL